MTISVSNLSRFLYSHFPEYPIISASKIIPLISFASLFLNEVIFFASFKILITGQGLGFSFFVLNMLISFAVSHAVKEIENRKV